MFSTKQREDGETESSELHVEELIYDDADALRAVLEFLRRQGDQFGTVVLHTQSDALEWILQDPRSATRRRAYRPAWHESNTQAMGIMYRSLANRPLIDACAGRDFGTGTCTIAFDITDATVPENTGTTIVRFTDGRAEALDGPTNADVTVRLDIAEFSSLIIGSVRLKPLADYGVVAVSDPAWVERADAVLAAAEPPRCTTWF